MYNYSPEFLFLSCTLYLVQIVLRNRGEFSPEWAPQKIVSIFSTRLPHYHVSRRHNAAQNIEESSPVYAEGPQPSACHSPAVPTAAPPASHGCRAIRRVQLHLTGCSARRRGWPPKVTITTLRPMGTTSVLTGARARGQAPWTPASLTHTHIHQHNLIPLDSWFISRDSTIPLVSLCVHTRRCTYNPAGLPVHSQGCTLTQNPDAIVALCHTTPSLRSSLPLSWQRYSDITTLTSFGDRTSKHPS